MTTRRSGSVPSRGEFATRVVIASIIALAVAALYVARDALILVYFAFLLAVALSPAVRVLERWALRPIGRVRLPRTLAILLLYLGILSVVGGVGVLVAQPAIEQASELWRALPQLVTRAEDFLLAKGILESRPSWQDVFQQAPGQRLFEAAQATGRGLVGGVFGTLALLVLVFYLLVESRTLFDEALGYVPPAQRQRVRQAATAITRKTSAWLAGHVLLGLIVGTSTALVLGLLGMPYYYPLAALSFVGEFFPYFGPLLAAVPGVLIGAANSWTMALEVGIFFLVQQQIENHVLVPQIFERRVGLSAVTVLVAILIGGELLGILGVVLAVPSAAIIQVVLEELVHDAS